MPIQSPTRPSPAQLRSVARRARHIILAIIALSVPLTADGAHAEPRAAAPAARALQVVAVPVNPCATAYRDGAKSDLPARRRFPALPAVSVSGYNLAVLGARHGSVAAKLTLGVDAGDPLRTRPLAPAVGIGVEYGF